MAAQQRSISIDVLAPGQAGDVVFIPAGPEHPHPFIITFGPALDVIRRRADSFDVRDGEP